MIYEKSLCEKCKSFIKLVEKSDGLYVKCKLHGITKALAVTPRKNGKCSDYTNNSEIWILDVKKWKWYRKED